MLTHVCRFEPWGVDVEVEHLDTVLSAARKGGVPLEATCGGRRACGTCAIDVIRGSLGQPSDEERAIIGGRSFRLGCRAQIVEDVVVRPLVGAASRAPESSSTAPSQGESTVCGGSTSNGYVAIDVGTTSIKIALKTEESTVYGSHVENSQKIWGADVISRLSAALADDKVAHEMHSAVSRDIAEALTSLIAETEYKMGSALNVGRCVIAGNVIMAALLCGTDLEEYAYPPYGKKESLELLSGPLFDALMCINETMTIDIVEPLGALVGGDIAAGLYELNAYGPLKDPLLFVDIGTNIETVLATNNSLYVGSAPAGSTFAFEGVKGSNALEDVSYLLEQGALLKSGLLDESSPLVIRNEKQILVARAKHGQVSQLDVRSIQLAKAAMSVSVAEVIHASGVKLSAIKHVYFGGAFSEHLKEVIESLALIPCDLFLDAEIEFRPDCALKGALKMTQVEDLKSLNSKKVIPINFAGDAHFPEHLMEHINF